VSLSLFEHPFDEIPRSAAIPGCGFTGHPCPVFRTGGWKAAQTGGQECPPYAVFPLNSQPSILNT
jgi:hypothetical protein